MKGKRKKGQTRGQRKTSNKNTRPSKRKSTRRRKKIQPRRRQSKSRKQSVVRKRRIRKSPKRSTQRRIGWARQVRVRHSKNFGRSIVVKKREIRLKPKERIKARRYTFEDPKKLKETVSGLIVELFHKDPETVDDLYFMRFRYSYKYGGKKQISYFAIPTGHAENEEQIEFLANEAMREFMARQKNYFYNGFRDVTVEGAMLTTYEESGDDVSGRVEAKNKKRPNKARSKSTVVEIKVASRKTRKRTRKAKPKNLRSKKRNKARK